MSELNPTRMAHLRALLNEPERNATQIITYLQEWPDDEGKHIAQSYADAYFARTSTQDTLEAMRTGKMYYDVMAKKLFTSDGTFIKQLSCPKTMCWDELEKTQNNDKQRHCGQCQKNVLNTDGMTDQQVLAVIQYDPTACVYINKEHGNVTMSHATDDTTQGPNHNTRHGCRVIRTARTKVAIDQGFEQGFWPVPKQVTSSNGKISSFLQVWQNKHTGEISIQYDMRYTGIHGEYNDWALVVSGGGYDASNHFPEPIAAYLVPREIKLGERVFLDDVIENLVGSVHQGSSRLMTAEAIWNGKDFTILHNEEEDVVMYVG